MANGIIKPVSVLSTIQWNRLRVAAAQSTPSTKAEAHALVCKVLERSPKLTVVDDAILDAVVNILGPPRLPLDGI